MIARMDVFLTYEFARYVNIGLSIEEAKAAAWKAARTTMHQNFPAESAAAAALFDSEFVTRIGKDFFDSVLLPRVAKELSSGRTYYDIRDSLRYELEEGGQR